MDSGDPAIAVTILVMVVTMFVIAFLARGDS